MGLRSCIVKKPTAVSPDVRKVARLWVSQGVADITLSLDPSVARRAESAQVVERVGVAALDEWPHVVNLEPLASTTARAAMSITCECCRPGSPPSLRAVGAAVWLKT